MAVVDLFHADPTLKNQYGYSQLNTTRVLGVEAGAARRFGDWLTGAEGQRAILDYRVDGMSVFTPNANDPTA